MAYGFCQLKFDSELEVPDVKISECVVGVSGIQKANRPRY